MHADSRTPPTENNLGKAIGERALELSTNDHKGIMDARAERAHAVDNGESPSSPGLAVARPPSREIGRNVPFGPDLACN